jgi:uncharacterized protein YjbK
MATADFSKLQKNHYFALHDFKLRQLLNGLSKRLFSIGYTLPYDQLEAIFSLSHVQNFLGDEGSAASLRTPETEGGTSPFWQPLDVPF